MTQDDDGFLKRLLATFKVEAQEHLAAMSAQLLALERPAPAAEVPGRVEVLFREAHSLKGAARSVNLTEVERLCQSLERVLSALKARQIELAPQFFDTLYTTLDTLGEMLARDIPGASTAVPLNAQLAALDALLQPRAEQPHAGYSPAAKEMPPSIPAAEAPIPAAGETVRIATAKLEALLAQAEELHAHKFSGGLLADELQDLSRLLTDWRRQWDKRARQARVTRRMLARTPDPAGARRQVQQLLESVDPDELFATSLADRLAQIERQAAQERRALAGRVDKLMDDVKQALMLPIATLFEPLPKLVRDLAHGSGKQVELVTRGETLEVDRRILEQLKVPLTHLIRNAVDHGIETPEQRRRAGKPPRGSIRIEFAARDGSKVGLQVSDDGAGISAAQVKAAALKSGVRAPRVLDAMNDEAALALVFESGLSTSPILTSLSGHGLGLAIVREKIERLGGSITLASTPGQGTRFAMLLPNTLAAFRGLLVAVGERQFVLPSHNVERVGRVRRDAIETSDGREAIRFDRQLLPLARLDDVLELHTAERGGTPVAAQQHVAVLASGGHRMAFAVDEVIGDQELLVKPLGPPLKRVRHVAAATVLGAGRVVPLLSVEDLMATALRGPQVQPRRAAPSGERRSLLVAEDSVTTRALLKEILESAGYEVSTAADGIEALTALHAGDFDLLVSDVEMPRMDGFDLTTRVRADRRLAELPVVLVTALESREDKERGVDVGANAYVVKSGFDKSRLLDIIRSLI